MFNRNDVTVWCGKMPLFERGPKAPIRSRSGYRLVFEKREKVIVVAYILEIVDYH